MSGNILFLGNKIFEIPPFFQTRPGDLGKQVHACSLRFSALKLSSILDRRITSFPGFFPKVSLSRSIEQVGENPGNEVGNRVENVHFMLRLHNRFALIEVRCSVRKLFSWPHVTKWCDNEAIACAICNDLGPTMTLLYHRTHIKFLYINTHSLSKICCDSACPFMW